MHRALTKKVYSESEFLSIYDYSQGTFLLCRGDLRVDRLRHEAAVGGHHGVLVLGAARRRPGVAPARHQPQRRLPEPQPWRGVGIYITFWLRLSVCMYACLFENHLVSSLVFTL